MIAVGGASLNEFLCGKADLPKINNKIKEALKVQCKFLPLEIAF